MMVGLLLKSGYSKRYPATRPAWLPNSASKTKDGHCGRGTLYRLIASKATQLPVVSAHYFPQRGYEDELYLALARPGLKSIASLLCSVHLADNYIYPIYNAAVNQSSHTITDSPRTRRHSASASWLPRCCSDFSRRRRSIYRSICLGRPFRTGLGSTRRSL